MHRLLVAAVLPALLATLAAPALSAGKVSREQIKGLDEQVQEIKADALGIAAELNRLEEKLLYPSNTQLAVFVSLAPGSKLRLDAIEIQLNGKPVAHHLYTLKELEALQRGGVQRIYVGNVRGGEHSLQVSATGKSALGADFRHNASHTLTKELSPRLVGITLGAAGGTSQDISFRDW